MLNEAHYLGGETIQHIIGAITHHLKKKMKKNEKSIKVSTVSKCSVKNKVSIRRPT
jgi:hypothetical protein